MTAKPIIGFIVGVVAVAVLLMAANAQVPVSFTPGAASPAPPVSYQNVAVQPQVLLQQAILAVESRSSIVARIRQTAHLFDHEIVGSGLYLQQQSDSGMQFRLELKTQAAAGEEPTSLLRVCDGRSLWSYNQCRGTENISYIDLRGVAQALEEVGRMPQPGIIGDWPALGGLPKLLRSLNASFDLTTIEPVELKSQLPAWRITGVWKPAVLRTMLPDQAKEIEQGKPANLDKLSGHLPDSVVLFLGRDDLFPYRVEYRHDHQVEGSIPAGQGRGEELLVAIDWFEVQFSVPINLQRFIYNPGAHAYTDDTRALLQRLGLK